MNKNQWMIYPFNSKRKFIAVEDLPISIKVDEAGLKKYMEELEVLNVQHDVMYYILAQPKLAGKQEQVTFSNLNHPANAEEAKSYMIKKKEKANELALPKS